MALVVGWYDFVCFGIVAAAFCGALCVIYRKECGGGCGRRCGGGRTSYESLLIAGREEGDRRYAAAATEAGDRGTGDVRWSQLWRSCWKGVHPGWLLGLRLVSFLVMAGLLAWDILDWGASIFIYYTEWTFALVMVYFAIGTVMSAYGWWEHSRMPPDEISSPFSAGALEEQRSTDTGICKAGDYTETIKLNGRPNQEENEKTAGFLGYSMQILYQTCAGAVILTDVVFWCVIVPFLSNAHLGLNLLMGCMHTLNAVFLILDTSVNSLPFPWFRLSYFVLWSCIYVVFQWAIHACGFLWWPYPFLMLSTPWAPLWYFCLALVHIPCYGAYSLLVKAKYSILPRLFPRAFVHL